MLKQLRRRINPNSLVAMLQVAISDVVYVAAVLLISSAGGASKLFALPGKSWGKLNMMILRIDAQTLSSLLVLPLKK